MPDVLEEATSGRAKCRGCGRAIAKGGLRFGEALPNAYGEGEALHWFHVLCAACMRPEKVALALDAHAREVPEREWLMETARVGALHHRLPRLTRVERASSGRAACRHCRNTIEKGAWRVALQMFEEGRMTPIGTIHLACAGSYFGTTDILPRLQRLTPNLDEVDVTEIARVLAESQPVAAWNAGATTDAEGASAEPAEGPGVAKAQPDEPAANARAKSS